MPTKKKHDTVKFDFRGLTFEVDKTAFASLKIQTALNLGEPSSCFPAYRSR